MSKSSRPIRGRWAARSLLLALLAAGGCNYGFQGGGGFPEEIRTLYIGTFENETREYQLPQEVFLEMQQRIPRALGVRPAGREVADAIVTGTITRFEDSALNYNAGTTNRETNVYQHQVQLAVTARIVDVKRNVILWESTVNGVGDWLTDSQSIEVGRRIAIEQVVQKIIDGAQSQW